MMRPTDRTPGKLTDMPQRISATLRTLWKLAVPKITLKLSQRWHVVGGLAVLKRPLVLGSVNLPQIVDAGVR